MIYNVLDARNNLSRLIGEVESGAEVTIARRGKPVARIVPIGHSDPTPPAPSETIAEWLARHPLSAEVAPPAVEIDALIEENRNAGA